MARSSRLVFGGLLGLVLALQIWTCVSPRPASTLAAQTTGEAAGEVMLATGTDQSGGKGVLYAYNARTGTLAVYSTTPSAGIEFLGARRLNCDFQVIEMPESAAQRPSSVKRICDLVSKQESSPTGQGRK
jgi:hypothetical protein